MPKRSPAIKTSTRRSGSRRRSAPGLSAADPPSGDVAYGDIDLSGAVTATDAYKAQMFFIGNIDLTPEEQRRADVNGDGVVNATDALLIEQYSLGEIDTFPAEESDGGNGGSGGSGGDGNGGNGGSGGSGGDGNGGNGGSGSDGDNGGTERIPYRDLINKTPQELRNYIRSRQGSVPTPPMNADQDSEAVCMLYAKETERAIDMPSRCYGSSAIYDVYGTYDPRNSGGGGGDNGSGGGGSNGGGSNGGGSGGGSPGGETSVEAGKPGQVVAGVKNSTLALGVGVFATGMIALASS